MLSISGHVQSLALPSGWTQVKELNAGWNTKLPLDYIILDAGQHQTSHRIRRGQQVLTTEGDKDNDADGVSAAGKQNECSKEATGF